jgi:hypothetical protein
MLWIFNRQLPAKQRRERIRWHSLLLGQRSKKSMRKEMDVCVRYGECAPGRLYHLPCSSGTETGKRVIPAARAT